MTLLKLSRRLSPPPWVHNAIEGVADVAGNWSKDRCGSMSAALAFYAAFSLAPLLVVAVAVGSLFFGVAAVEGNLYTQLETAIGADAAKTVQLVLANAWRADQARAMGAVSAIAIAIGATATFVELNSALNAIWRAPPPQRAVAAVVRVRLISFGLVLATGFLLVILLIADAAIMLVTEKLFGSGLLTTLADAIQQSVSFAFLCTAFCILLKVLPDVPVAWREAWTGGIAGAMLFSGGKHLFALYLARAGGINVFGAASSLAVLMMWLYFSAAAFLLGAEIAAYIGRARRVARAKRRNKETEPWQSR